MITVGAMYVNVMQLVNTLNDANLDECLKSWVGDRRLVAVSQREL
jgi:hypothetical protein